MKILFEGGWWDNGPVSNRQVVRELVLAWSESFPDDEVFVLVPDSAAESARQTLPETTGIVTTRLRQQGLIAMFATGLANRRVGADAVLTQNFAPVVGKTRATVLLHDRLFISNPEWFTWLEQRYFDVMTRSLRRAKNIVATSATEAEAIVASGLADHVESIGLAPGSELLGATESNPGIEVEDGRFWLAVGRLNVRKNLEFAIRSGVEAGVISPDCPLVVVGAADGKSTALGTLSGLVDEGSLRFTGHVAPGELVWLYRRARGLFFMSRGEGFGLPPLEALHFGCPPVVSDIPVMREITGNSAVYVPLDDVEGASRLLATLTPESLRSSAAQAGRFAAESYSWPQTVQRLRRAMVEGPDR